MSEQAQPQWISIESVNVASRQGAEPTPGLRARRPIPPKLYRIGELVEYSGLSRQTIHNYTTMGLLKESRWTGGGHRLYDASAFNRLNVIAELKTQRQSLEYMRKYFAQLDARLDARLDAQQAGEASPSSS